MIEEEASVNGGPSLQYMLGAEESLHRQSAGSRQQFTTTLNEQAVIEYEHALMALQKMPSIGNPCLKRTMNLGPKKFIGTQPNQQIHRHTNKGI